VLLRRRLMCVGWATGLVGRWICRILRACCGQPGERHPSRSLLADPELGLWGCLRALVRVLGLPVPASPRLLTRNPAPRCCFPLPGQARGANSGRVPSAGSEFAFGPGVCRVGCLWTGEKTASRVSSVLRRGALEVPAGRATCCSAQIDFILLFPQGRSWITKPARRWKKFSSGSSSKLLIWSRRAWMKM